MMPRNKKGSIPVMACKLPERSPPPIAGFESLVITPRTAGFALAIICIQDGAALETVTDCNADNLSVGIIAFLLLLVLMSFRVVVALLVR